MYILLLTVIIICSLLYVNYFVRSSRIREVLQYPPCFPTTELPICGSVYHFMTNSEGAMEALLRMGRGAMKAGGIGRMNACFKYYLVLTDADDITEALSNYSEKDYMYTFLHIMSGNGSVFVPDPSISKVRRRAILPAMSPKRLANFIPLIWTEGEWLTNSLAKYVGKGPVSVEKYLSGFCCNVIMSTGGVQEMKEQVSVVELLTHFNRFFALMFDRMTSVWMYSDFVYSFTSNCKETRKFVKLFYEYADRAQEVRRNKLARYKSLTDEMRDKEKLEFGLLDEMINSNILNEREISEEILILVGAADEASIAMGFTLLLLAQYPSVQDKLYQEIKEIFGDSERPLSKDDLMKMTYLDMVIKESMRLYPPVPFVMRSANKVIKLSSGRIIPEGVGVIVPIISLHRNPKYWGSDSEHFDPERFRPERAPVSDNVFLPFGCGPRGCPGYKFGHYIVKIGLTAILRKYKVVGTPASSTIPNIRAKLEVVLKTVNRVEIQLENRN